MFQEFVRRLFSDKCQLTSLKVDVSINDSNATVHPYFSLINNEIGTHCISLRYLHIHLSSGCLFEHIVEHVPNLEILSVEFQSFLIRQWHPILNTETFLPINADWCNKVKEIDRKCCTREKLNSFWQLYIILQNFYCHFHFRTFFPCNIGN